VTHHRVESASYRLPYRTASFILGDVGEKHRDADAHEGGALEITQTCGVPGFPTRNDLIQRIDSRLGHPHVQPPVNRDHRARVSPFRGDRDWNVSH
jgi:hypothetical protein